MRNNVEIQKCKICGSDITLPTGKCLWCKYENEPKGCKESYKKAFYKLRKAFEEYRQKEDELICLIRGERSEANKEAKFWKKTCIASWVLWAVTVVFTVILSLTI